MGSEMCIRDRLRGANNGVYSRLTSDYSNLAIIASGGVGSREDLDSLVETGVEGVILGKAIYEGKVSLKELSNFTGN